MRKLGDAKKKSVLQFRARIIQAIRDFFQAGGYLEVETPLRIPAPIPEAHIDLIAAEGWHLQPSPEVCMKQLLAAGYDKIFQICKCFRAKERGQNHLPEFTMLEWYARGMDYQDMRHESEAMIRRVAKAVGHGDSLNYQGKTISLAAKWPQMTVREAFLQHSNTTMEQALAEQRFDEVMGLEIEPQLGNDRPLFLYDYPAAIPTLARISPADPTVVERFELYIAGLELCNAFSELTDPELQRRRFHHELRLREQQGKAALPMPERFLSALADMPEASGNALGVDRLVMLLSDVGDIDDAVAFAPEQL